MFFFCVYVSKLKLFGSSSGQERKVNRGPAYALLGRAQEAALKILKKALACFKDTLAT